MLALRFCAYKRDLGASGSDQTATIPSGLSSPAIYKCLKQRTLGYLKTDAAAAALLLRLLRHKNEKGFVAQRWAPLAVKSQQ